MKKLPNKTECLQILRMMRFIREVELGIAERYPNGKMRCPTHLSVGQECVPAVLNVLLNHDDKAVTTHRSHAHYLGKGGDLKAMLAEIYGKVTGCAKGRGGSMHLIDESVGFVGSTAIVGNTIPIGVGLGLGKKVKKESGIAVVFLGDGATEEGVFYESVNFAVVQQLPVLFVCENNQYSVYSNLSPRQPEGRKIYEMVAAMGIASYCADGNVVSDTFATLQDAISNIKSGKGPAFVELSTYRWLEHCGPFYDNDIGYRDEEEFLAYKEREPIGAFEKVLLENQLIQPAEIEQMQSLLQQQIAEAFEFAEQSPFPSPDEAYSSAFAEEFAS